MSRVDDMDAAESQQRREDAKAIKGGRAQPQLKEGELVAINQYGTRTRSTAMRPEPTASKSTPSLARSIRRRCPM